MIGKKFEELVELLNEWCKKNRIDYGHPTITVASWTKQAGSDLNPIYIGHEGKVRFEVSEGKVWNVYIFYNRGREIWDFSVAQWTNGAITELRDVELAEELIDKAIEKVKQMLSS